MKVSILSRKKVDGKTYRELSCGHEQVETSGGKSHLFTEAHCKACGPGAPKAAKPRVKAAPKPKPVAILKPKPEGASATVRAPSKSKVEVRCSQPKLHEAEFSRCKAKCLTCHQWVCGKCEGSNLRLGSRAVPCDRCWLSGEGLTALLVRPPRSKSTPVVLPVLVPPAEIQVAV